MLEFLKVVGSVLGILAFGWKVWDSFASYLYIDITVDSDGKVVSAKTVVENRSGRDKKINNALLLIGPEEESPVDTFNRLSKVATLGMEVRSTNEIAAVQLSAPIYDGEGRAIIPLPFYYSENITIGDERLNYRATLDSDKLNSGRAYSVRFFVWATGRYHRSTHDSFVLKEKRPTIGSI
ncbi:MAG: hypothetical protein HY776_08660 [Actinobacteria bacterium]|nr:hypothetical protein [Actinomycetota bacterium]